MIMLAIFISGILIGFYIGHRRGAAMTSDQWTDHDSTSGHIVKRRGREYMIIPVGEIIETQETLTRISNEQ